MIPNDYYYSYQWHLPKIQCPEAWDLTLGTTNIVVAVLDSGVESTHPDLAPVLLPGWNALDNNTDTRDVTSHGTFVAGAAAALGQNSIGVASVAWGCRVMPIRVTDTNGYTSSALLASGLTYAADNGCKVANMSFRTTTSLTLSNALVYFRSKGGVVTASAGNEGVADASPNDPNLIIVGATDSGDLLASFSNQGAFVDLVAPGVSVASTGRNGSYGTTSGTSMSAPIVAGVAALVFSANPALTPAQVGQILTSTADDLGTPGWDQGYGWGRVNAYRAVQAALTTAPGDGVPPTASVLSPGTGSTISGAVNVQVNAVDNQAIAKVDVFANELFIGSLSSASGAVAWDTSKSTNGSYYVQARAYDAAGNEGSSPAVSVSVNNIVPDTTAPTVSISSPAAGATVSGTVSVSVSASDAGGIAKVELLVGSSVIGTATTSPATLSWNTTTLANGSYTLTARAYDKAGNMAVSVSKTVTVQNTVADTTPPSATITSPTSGSTVSKTVSVKVTASDNVKATRVDLYVDGKFISSTTTIPSTFSWNASKAARGAHTLQAKAYDAAGNTAMSPTVTVNK
jgi:hypothetical protein